MKRFGFVRLKENLRDFNYFHHKRDFFEFSSIVCEYLIQIKKKQFLFFE